MDDDGIPRADELPPDQFKQLVKICLDFEAAWERGERPPPERVLSGRGAIPLGTLLTELLAIDVEHRRDAGEHPEPADYLARFPEDEPAVRAAFRGEPVVSTKSFNEPPKQLGRFQCVRVLGRGGQAETILAQDPVLGRLVVLKRYHRPTRPGVAEAVLNEARSQVRADGTGVADCFEVLEIDGAPTLVMEYIPGRPLSALTDAERRYFRRSARWVEHLAEGLSRVHARGLLHRDIKPSNIILGDDGEPRLVDFGLSAPLASAELGNVSGSPPFMAPEQARGQGERVDARTDVFGLGGVLYWLLTGCPPFDADTQSAALAKARDGVVTPPREIAPKVPRSLERICLRAMAAAPEARYESAAEMAGALKRSRLVGPWATVLAAGSIVLAVSLVLVASWPAGREDEEVHSPVTVGGGATPVADVVGAIPTAVAPRIEALEVLLYPVNDEGEYEPTRTLWRGLNATYGAMLYDEVEVRATLDAPGYCYLIAFRADGVIEVCDPVRDDAAPEPTDRPAYPPSTLDETIYTLSDGTGLHAFALIVSAGPLPPFREWQSNLDGVPWRSGLPGEPGTCWSFDGQFTTAYSADDADGTRGAGGRRRGDRPVVSELAAWLRERPGVDELAIEAFTIEPRPGGDVPPP